MKRTILLSILAAALVWPASAAAPLRVSFQGKLEDGGQPATGTRNFVFKLYDALTGGTLLWTSQTEAVTVTNGVFTVVLQTGTPVNLSTGTFSGARFVEITVDGTLLSPREEVVSAPYALVAQSLATGASVPLASLEKDPSAASTLNLATNPVDWSQLKNVPAGFADGADDSAGALTVQEGGATVLTPATTLDFNAAQFTTSPSAPTVTFALDSSSVTLQGNAFNGASQLVRLDGTGKLPVLDGSALTGISASAVAAANVTAGTLIATVVASSVPALNVGVGKLGPQVVAASVAVNGVHTGAIADSAITDIKISAVSSSKLSGGVPTALVDLTTVTAALSGKLGTGAAIPLGQVTGVAASTDTVSLVRMIGVTASTHSIAGSRIVNFFSSTNTVPGTNVDFSTVTTALNGKLAASATIPLNQVTGVAASTDTISLIRITGVAASTDTVPMARITGALSSTTTVPAAIVDLSTAAGYGANTFTGKQTVTALEGVEVAFGVTAATITLSGGIHASSATFTGDAEARGGILVGTGGTKITKHLSASFALDAGSITTPPECADLAGNTLTGAAFGDTVTVSADVALPANFTLQAFVSAADTVAIRWCQLAGAGADPDGAGAAYRVDVWKH